MEIRPVDRGFVVIKGIAASQFLCILGNGRLYSSVSSIRECGCEISGFLIDQNQALYINVHMIHMLQVISRRILSRLIFNTALLELMKHLENIVEVSITECYYFL